MNYPIHRLFCNGTRTLVSLMDPDQMKRIFDALVVQVPLTNQRHDHRYKQAEQNDNGINMYLEAYQDCIYHQHGENAQVLVEILDRYGMACPHEDVPAVL